LFCSGTRAKGVGRAVVGAAVEERDAPGGFAPAEKLNGPYPLALIDGPDGQPEPVQQFERFGVHHERPGLFDWTPLLVDDPEGDTLRGEDVRRREPRGAGADH